MSTISQGLYLCITITELDEDLDAAVRTIQDLQDDSQAAVSISNT